MKYWPVPDSYTKVIPEAGSLGSFWEKRSERYHCGVDIYAPEGSDVLSVESGEVTNIGVFTSPGKVSYWNTTYFLLIKNSTGFVCKYAELEDVAVAINESVKAGQVIGHIGMVLNKDKITGESPIYIQKLKKNKTLCMLHFELYKSTPAYTEEYSGGNWFGSKHPNELIDPTEYLQSITHFPV
jgi:murein DD-endopeptidase MepM/ murein hydrolase activator NlpD